MLYDGVVGLISQNLDRLATEHIIPAFPSNIDKEPVQLAQDNIKLMKEVEMVWADHSSNMDKIGSILKYMDRVLTKEAGVPSILEKGRDLFLKHIIRPPIIDHIVSSILKLLRIDRDGYITDLFALQGCVQVLLNLQLSDGAEYTSVYKRDLEPSILRETTEFYAAEGVRLLQTCGASEFLCKVETRLKEEDTRAHQSLSLTTAPALKRILQDTLLAPHLSDILRKEGSWLDVMIDLDKFEDLSRMYSLFSHVPTGVRVMRRALKDSIARRGAELITLTPGDVEAAVGGEDEVGVGGTKGGGKGKARAPAVTSQDLSFALKWVEDVLAVKDKLDAALNESFARDRELESGINEAFELIVSQQPRAPEFISLFIDENLKKGLKGKTDQEVENVLEKTVMVFRFLTEKDVFERYYKGHLAKRLLHGRSVSDDAERGMLAKLKVECGYQFTQKLEGMFHDMKTSSDTMQAYKTHLAALPVRNVPNTLWLSLTPLQSQEIDLSVTVMTSTFWPIPSDRTPYILTPILTRACRSFEQFYLSRHSGRRLTWQLSLGHADVRATFKTRTHDLNVSTLALVILLLFESVSDGDFLKYEDIKTATQIPEPELQRHLQSLACAKYKVLRKHPPGRDVNVDDSFSFNTDFTARLQKIKISTVAARVESGEERKETQNRVEEERRHQTEACIVRIMKDRKHMTHNELINEVTLQLASRFQPNPLNIKKRIEGLIEREYLERCEDRKSYNYLVCTVFVSSATLVVLIASSQA
ncbi:Cullin-domain-containing protein [Vararia minispora EC-137]|uniref:Cullin-domain-containing protein n=1 Tax=Vararia minispora EC-137 TaxID=1314806 RepID=A0ACB8QP82_9AGAM|nr:Cullin-domain-containing protein [Vararia minispora EC-137]